MKIDCLLFDSVAISFTLITYKVYDKYENKNIFVTRYRMVGKKVYNSKTNIPNSVFLRKFVYVICYVVVNSRKRQRRFIQNLENLDLDKITSSTHETNI